MFDLPSKNVLEFYKKGSITFEYLVSLESEEIKTLSQYGHLVEKGYIPADQLKVLLPSRIEVLFKHGIPLVEKNIIPTDQISSYYTHDIEVLSQYGIPLIEKGYITSDKLLGVSPINKLEAVFNCVKLLEKKYTSVEELVSLDSEMLKYLSQPKVFNILKLLEESYTTCPTILEILKEKTGTEKLPTLYSENALTLYKKKYTTFEKLTIYNKDKITALTSDVALRAYEQKGYSY